MLHFDHNGEAPFLQYNKASSFQSFESEVLDRESLFDYVHSGHFYECDARVIFICVSSIEEEI